ncbi:MAG: hypothetical protein WC683_07000 [bacterium]
MTLTINFLMTGNRILTAAALLRVLRQLARAAAAADRRTYAY